MKRVHANLVALAHGLAAAAIWTACNGATQSPDAGFPSISPVELDTTSLDGAGSGQVGPHLGSLHPGWKRARCLDCHDRVAVSLIHQGAVHVPPACVSCHGYNGAVHADHAADPAGQCAECHSAGAVVSDHLTDFALPQDCATCHVHPANRGGL